MKTTYRMIFGLGIFLFGVLVSGSTRAMEFRCVDLLSNSIPLVDYTNEDFPESKYWVPSLRDGKAQVNYSGSAAQLANRISQDLLKGLTVSSAFQLAEQWRGNFKPFQIYPRPPGRDYWTALIDRYFDYGVRMALWLRRTGQREVPTWYITQKGTRVASTTLGPGMEVHHPLDYQPILQDALSLLERSLTPSTEISDTEAERMFVESMYAYYIAMPYNRGSAAIGKVVFAGVYKARFHHPLRLPDGIDLEAILHSREEQKEDFIQQTLTYMHQN